MNNNKNIITLLTNYAVISINGSLEDLNSLLTKDSFTSCNEHVNEGCFSIHFIHCFRACW